MAGKYSLYKRKLRKGPIWYFRVTGEPGRPWHSTGKARKDEAEAFVEKWLRDEPLPNTLAEFGDDFFVWATCTWIKLQHEKGKRFSRSWPIAARSTPAIRSLTTKLEAQASGSSWSSTAAPPSAAVL